MFRALHSAASGMLAQQMNLDNIANNLANANTNGFQSRRLQFQDLLYENVVVPGSASTQQTTQASGLQLGTGTRPSSTEMLQTQGDLQQTGNQLDLAIQGPGYFQVKMPDGSYGYTRDGSFQLDAQGNIVDANGNSLQPNISVPLNASAITVGSDGTVSVTLPNQNNSQTIGTITLATFANPGGLNSSGNNLSFPTTASGPAIVGTPGGSEGTGQLAQGALEQSNVNVVNEFIAMIEAQRSYEASSKVVKAADEMFMDVNNLVQ